jgi:hypothetical protein
MKNYSSDSQNNNHVDVSELDILESIHKCFREFRIFN